jgi:ornithine decarboxylase
VFNLLRKHGHTPNTIDIGGGFSANPTEFQPAAAAIRKALEKVPKNRTIIAEPGRFIAQPCQDLFVKVIARKPGQAGGWRYVIDESLYGHFSCIPFDHQTPPWFRVLGEDIGRPVTDSILFGRTCDSLDVIARGPMEELYVGDWLYFPLMGAYTSATASEFNGFPKPHIVSEDSEILPTNAEAWDLVKDFQKSNVCLKYSNALVPIL